ncbi:MAG: SLC13 family permease [Salinivirgaceae bacterium]
MFDLIYTGSVIVLMTALLIKEVTRPSMILFSTLLLLILGKIITVEEALHGFSNQGMLTVGLLFIVAAAIQSSSRFENIVTWLLGKRKDVKLRYTRLMFPVATLSAFINNTPVVASLIPIVSSWAKKNGLPVSKFLIPLSYAAILGGLCTLIGTSTNLVIHGMMLDNGMEGFAFFDIGKVGFPVAIIGITFFTIFGKRILPIRKLALVQFEENTRKFVVELQVNKNYPHIGKSLHEAGLRRLQGLYLFQIIRDGKTIAPVSRHEILHENDHLFFTGLPETIFELQKEQGLTIVPDGQYDPQNIDSDKIKTYEVVISNVSPLLGKKVKNSNFRNRYNAAILGIHRAGSRINEKIGDIELKANDTLFILAQKDFYDKWYHSMDFSLVTSSVESYSKPEKKGNIALILLVAMIAAATLKLIPIMLSAAITVILLIMGKIISFNDAKKSVDMDVLIIIASAFGIGNAMMNSGLANYVAVAIIAALRGLGPIGIVAGMFIVTSIYTEIITNNAGAAIMFPIALSVSQNLQMDAMPFIMAVVIGASASFATPIGYQTNLLVYNVGGYKFTDFLRTGLMMNILAGIVTVFMIWYWYL